MNKVVIFDFDGTLVDTITDVGICFNQSLEENGFPQHPLEMFGSFAGGNLETVVSKMLPKDQCTTTNIDLVKNRYRELYLSSPKPNTRPYPGVPELIRSLKSRGIQIAINSNKGQLLLDQMVKDIFPADTFSAVVGYREELPSKPDPFGVNTILHSCNCLPENALYVGDGLSDVLTAENAGIPCIFVMWGQGDWSKINRPHLACAARVAELEHMIHLLLVGKEA